MTSVRRELSDVEEVALREFWTVVVAYANELYPDDDGEGLERIDKGLQSAMQRGLDAAGAAAAARVRAQIAERIAAKAADYHLGARFAEPAAARIECGAIAGALDMAAKIAREHAGVPAAGPTDRPCPQCGFRPDTPNHEHGCAPDQPEEKP